MAKHPKEPLTAEQRKVLAEADTPVELPGIPHELLASELPASQPARAAARRWPIVIGVAIVLLAGSAWWGATWLAPRLDGAAPAPAPVAATPSAAPADPVPATTAPSEAATAAAAVVEPPVAIVPAAPSEGEAAPAEPPVNEAPPALPPAEAPAIEPPPSSSVDPFVAIPAGAFRMGSTSGDKDERPIHEVTLSPFQLDRTEVTVAAYARCVDAKRCPTTGLGVSNERKSTMCNWGREGRAEHPINCVDWNQANGYCAWAGQRLPTEAEWERAARGGDERLFAWGDQVPGPGDRFGNVADEAAKERAHPTWSIVEGYDDGFADTAPVGSFPAGASSAGALDLTGNVWEWVSDRYSAGYYAKSPSQDPTGPRTGETRVIRGGAFEDVAKHFRTTNRGFTAPATRTAAIGFRCARNAGGP